MSSMPTFFFPGPKAAPTPKSTQEREDANVPPEWVLKRVDDQIAANHFKLQEMMEAFEKTMDTQQSKIEEMMHQFASLAEEVLSEKRRGEDRDRTLSFLKAGLKSGSMGGSRGGSRNTTPRVDFQVGSEPWQQREEQTPNVDVKDLRIKLMESQRFVDNLAARVNKMERGFEETYGECSKALVASERIEGDVNRLRYEIELVDRRMQLQAAHSGLLIFNVLAAHTDARAHAQVSLMKRQKDLAAEVAELSKKVGSSNAVRLMFKHEPIHDELIGGNPLDEILEHAMKSGFSDTSRKE
eukprot:TRINITY_DN12086_c0_g2_i1.p1 TRINITY_DN12086_c0_g2~~TRINITY_DN12086_c0_g2_i1.p1  ORF type:complete len:297 (-),score=57.27 TRINITY_DN12086_c0_g2_i1:129-1019(-)